MGPKQLLKYQDLVDDAVSKGARVLHGGEIPKAGSALATGCFYPPTVLVDVSETAKIAQEEIFGPIMCVFKVKGTRELYNDLTHSLTHSLTHLLTHSLTHSLMTPSLIQVTATMRLSGWRIIAILPYHHVPLVVIITEQGN